MSSIRGLLAAPAAAELGSLSAEASLLVIAALFAVGLALGTVVRVVSISTYADCERSCSPLPVAEFQPSAIPVCRCLARAAEVTP